MLHSDVMSNPQQFLTLLFVIVLYDIDIFEEYKLVILESIPHFGFVQCFLIIRSQLCFLAGIL